MKRRKKSEIKAEFRDLKGETYERIKRAWADPDFQKVALELRSVLWGSEKAPGNYELNATIPAEHAAVAWPLFEMLIEQFDLTDDQVWRYLVDEELSIYPVLITAYLKPTSSGTDMLIIQADPEIRQKDMERAWPYIERVKQSALSYKAAHQPKRKLERDEAIIAAKEAGLSYQEIREALADGNLPGYPGKQAISREGVIAVVKRQRGSTSK